MVQQEVLGPELRQEQWPWVKPEPVPDAVLSHPWEPEWTGRDSSQKPYLVAGGSRTFIIQVVVEREATMVDSSRGCPEAAASRLPSLLTPVS